MMKTGTQLSCHLSRTPIGALLLEASEEGLTRVHFLDRVPASSRPASRARGDAVEHLRKASSQLQEYFTGKRQRFQLELDLHGTDFDCELWQLLLKIPFGKTRTYGQLARELGGVSLARAVGGACGRNPIPVIVPCHRVIGADHSLTGFGGGLGRKGKLLILEGAAFGEPQLNLFPP